MSIKKSKVLFFMIIFVILLFCIGSPSIISAQQTLISNQKIPLQGLIQTGSQNATTGIQTFTKPNTSVLTAYSATQGADGWIFPALNDYQHAFFHINHILILSGFVFFILTSIILFAFLYCYKFKKYREEANLRNEEQRKYFTYYDALTNLPNRKGILEKFGHLVETYQESGLNGGALFLDVDSLRSINNTFGHDTGDKLLHESAERLKHSVVSEDIVGRTGSDEFVVLVHRINTEQELEALVKKIDAVFREPYMVNGIVIQLTCSIGALLFCYKEKGQAVRFEDIFDRGEFVLDEAKQTQKGSYVLFNEEFGDRIDKRFRLERSLKSSIVNNELLCYFQPQYNCIEKTITGFETLARWKSAEFGMISPVTFIPMAEKSGFIKELGQYVIESAFAFAKRMEGRNITVSFNASPMEILEANYTNYIIGRYESYGLAPNSIAIEVTESCLIESFDKVSDKLEQLRQHGILIYLDDFGTGFSSLTYLKNLPINSIKIDKSFIDEIDTKDVEKDIVCMIVKLAHRLNFEVIAEGVETEEQIRCVAQAGCHMVQGYYISHPVPENEVLPLLNKLDRHNGTFKQ